MPPSSARVASRWGRLFVCGCPLQDQKDRRSIPDRRSEHSPEYPLSLRDRRLRQSPRRRRSQDQQGTTLSLPLLSWRHPSCSLGADAARRGRAGIPGRAVQWNSSGHDAHHACARVSAIPKAIIRQERPLVNCQILPTAMWSLGACPCGFGHQPPGAHPDSGRMKLPMSSWISAVQIVGNPSSPWTK
jgi:hypothetical protein